MREEYLWDRSGPPDPEVERLEKLLAPLGHRAGPAVPLKRPRPWRAMMAAAAVLLAAVSISQVRTPAPGPATGWEVTQLDGAAQLGGRDAEIAMPLRAGQSLRTAKDARLMLQDDDLGRIDLGPESEIRATSNRRVQLNRGKLHAFIWAPPRQFVVDTLSSRAIDLGCEYTLDMDAAGNGLLKVAMGWVAFQFDGHESFIPAGAQCVTRKRTGPGIPYYEDATAALRAVGGAVRAGGSRGAARHPRERAAARRLDVVAPADASRCSGARRGFRPLRAISECPPGGLARTRPAQGSGGARSMLECARTGEHRMVARMGTELDEVDLRACPDVLDSHPQSRFERLGCDSGAVRRHDHVRELRERVAWR